MTKQQTKTGNEGCCIKRGKGSPHQKKDPRTGQLKQPHTQPFIYHLLTSCRTSSLFSSIVGLLGLQLATLDGYYAMQCAVLRRHASVHGWIDGVPGVDMILILWARGGETGARTSTQARPTKGVEMESRRGRGETLGGTSPLCPSKVIENKKRGKDRVR